MICPLFVGVRSSQNENSLHIVHMQAVSIKFGVLKEKGE